MRTKEEIKRLYKRVERWGKLTYEERERRMRIWRHNSLLGHVAMARSNMGAVETVSTTSARAREIAGKIRICWRTWTKNSGRRALTRNKLVSIGYPEGLKK